MTKLLGIVMAAGLLAAGGCSKQEDGKAQPAAAAAAATPAATAAPAAAATGSKAIGACDRREKEHLCGEYHGAAKLSWVKEECQARGVPFVESCPKEGAVGRCADEVGTPMEVHTVHYAPATKETFAAMCKPPMQSREP